MSSDPTKGWKVQVDPDLPGDPKLLRLAATIKADVHKLDRLEEIVALGLLIKLWCFTMRREDSGVLHGWAPEDVARECGWTGDVDPAKFIEGMLNCGRTSIRKDGKGFIVQTGPDYEVHKWKEWQNDPEGTRKKWRQWRTDRRERKKSGGETATPEPKTGQAGDDTVTRTMLQLLKDCHITGSMQQKRDHIGAWRAAGVIEKAQSVITGIGKGKDIFWIAKALNGTPAAAALGPAADSISKIRDKFLSGGNQ